MTHASKPLLAFLCLNLFGIALADVNVGTMIDRRILPVVGSTPGANGTYFRTSVQIHNPGDAPTTGRIVFHSSGAAASDGDPALSYSVAPGQTHSIADLLPAMGASGLGSADIEFTFTDAPVVTVRVFNDAGPSGTTGFTEQAMRVEDALQAGQAGLVLIPSDFTIARFNVGIRTLKEGASVTFTLRDAAGAVFGSTTRDFPPEYHEQHSAAGFLRIHEVPPGGAIRIAVNSGAAIVYGVSVDNVTGDASLQVAHASFPIGGSPTLTRTPLPRSTATLTPTRTPTPTRTRTLVRTRTPLRTSTPLPTSTTRSPTLTPTEDPCGWWCY